jgi:hypothetical protein
MFGLRFVFGSPFGSKPRVLRAWKRVGSLASSYPMALRPFSVVSVVGEPGSLLSVSSCAA